MTKQWKYNLAGILAVVILTFLDQWTKRLAVLHLKDQEPFVLIKGVFELNYLENRGAAFGIFQGQRAVFLLCTLVILALVAVCYCRLPENKRFHPLRLTGMLLAAGAIGNMIDRAANSFVVDFLYFKLIDFPVFNVADIYVTVSMAILVILWIFYYKEEEFDFLFDRNKDRAGG